MKLDYIMIDEGWYTKSDSQYGPSDVTRPVADLDMAEIVGYARSHGIGIWVWGHWRHLERQMDDALSTYQRWGLKGIKVDFMDRNDQDMVAFYHSVLSKAAEHHLMVDLHGAYPPDGLMRTYPNFVTQEGVLGAEYNKVSTRVTATHNVTLPFTRMILGPMDYTPGGFRALSSRVFAARRRYDRPFVQTSRGHDQRAAATHSCALVLSSGPSPLHGQYSERRKDSQSSRCRQQGRNVRGLAGTDPKGERRRGRHLHGPRAPSGPQPVPPLRVVVISDRMERRPGRRRRPPGEDI